MGIRTVYFSYTGIVNDGARRETFAQSRRGDTEKEIGTQSEMQETWRETTVRDTGNTERDGGHI